MSAGRPLRVALAGPMGAGKSTVGSLLAARLGVPFADLDVRITAACAEGDGIAGLFAREGEEGFRRREAQALEEAVRDDGVLALGGGTVVDPAHRTLLKTHGWRSFVLQAPVATLLSRIGPDDRRPLVHDLDRLVITRADAYLAAGETLLTEGLTVNQVVTELLVRLGRR